MNLLDHVRNIIVSADNLKDSQDLDYHDSALFMQIAKKVKDFEAKFIISQIKKRKEKAAA